MENIFNNNIKKVIIAVKRKRQINNFYIKKIKDGKTKKAILIDSVFLKILISFFLYLFFLYSINNLIISLLVSILFLVFYSYISYKIKKAIFIKKVNEINEKMGKNIILSKIKNFSNREFVEYGKEILDKYYEKNFYQCYEDIDLIGKIEDNIYGVKCIKKNSDERVNLKDLNKIIKEKTDKKIERAIIITNSYFTDEVIKCSDVDLLLVDFDKFIEIIKKVKMYPTKEEIEELIYNRHEENVRRILKERKKVFDENKIIKYLILGVVLLFLSKKVVSFYLYYMIMAVISFVLAIISFIIYIIRLIRNKKRTILHK